MRALLLAAPVAMAALFAAFAGSGRAQAASPWAGHWETIFVMGDPALKATLDITDGRLDLVRLRDNIPAEAWNNPDCHGPGTAFGIGRPEGVNLRAAFVWLCDDGGFSFSVRFLRLNDHGDANPANDEVAFCTGTLVTTCSVVFHH